MSKNLQNWQKLEVSVIVFVLALIFLNLVTMCEARGQPAMERYQSCVLFENDWYEGKTAAQKEISNREQFLDHIYALNKNKYKAVHRMFGSRDEANQLINLIQRISAEHRIPVSVIFSQLIIESAWMNSKLFRKGNNGFCIKYYKSKPVPAYIKKASGRPMNIHDDNADDLFWTYDNFITSLSHYGWFVNRDHYQKHIDDRYNFWEWTNALRKGGYATNKDYQRKMIKLNRKYKLYLLNINWDTIGT